MFGISWLDPHTLIASLNGFALFAILAIVFIEMGLLIGFFLPGDSLLFVTGLAVAHGDIRVGDYVVPIWLMCVLVPIASFLGDSLGYWIGRRWGSTLFNRPNSRFFSQKNVQKTHEFFERHGSGAVILSHFVVVIRTFVPVAAGIGGMDRRKFLRNAAIGSVVWGAGITLLGVFLGRIQFVAEHIDLFTILFLVLSAIPVVFEGMKARREAKAKAAEVKAND
jgi:membrane-associated protein